MEHPAERLVLHVDMDCFFAAVEEREDPSLRGRPVIVGADPQGGRARGIVATCNYEARRFGIRSAMPISTAWRLAPNAVYLRPRFPLYSQSSRAIMEILRSHADLLEPAGIDEAYLDVSSRRTFEAARDLGRRIQGEVRERERLSCSIGAGPNKLVAKIASDHKKPGGLTVVLPSRVAEFLGPKDARALWGVGPKTRERLEALGLRTVADVAAASEFRLEREFGRFGPWLKREAQGQDDRPVDPVWEQKSIGREHTFAEDTGDLEVLRSTLLALVDEVRDELAADGHWCRTLTVKARYEGYETHTRQTTLRLSTSRLDQMRAAALELIAPFLATGRRLRLVGFSVGKLVPPEDLLPLG